MQQWAITILAAVASSLVSYAFGRVQKSAVSDDRVTTLGVRVSKLEDTVSSHGNQLSVQLEINRQFYDVRDELRKLTNSLATLLGRLDRKVDSQ